MTGFETKINDARLDTEICRAMFEKNPDKMIELLSEWLETNQLMTSPDFRTPAYLDQILAGSRQIPDSKRKWRVLVS